MNLERSFLYLSIGAFRVDSWSSQSRVKRNNPRIHTKRTVTRRYLKATMKNTLLFLALFNLCSALTIAQECKLSQAFLQSDADAPGGTTRVWADQTNSSLFFAEALNVNTDGTRRSYSVTDFWGTASAINNLCNAMKDACAGLTSDGLRQRRILTQQAFAAGWPADKLKETKISPDIIPFKNGRPCAPVNGFLVSATTLHAPNTQDPCDISNYVDALEVAALVLPKNPPNSISGFTQRNAKVGDLVVALLPGSNNPVFAVVGDLGPSNRLGEGTVALAAKLLGKTAPPKNYNEIRGRAEFVGRGWTVPRAFVLIFPGTRDVANPFMTTLRIDAVARTKFEAWGGVARLMVCAREYGQH